MRIECPTSEEAVPKIKRWKLSTLSISRPKRVQFKGPIDKETLIIINKYVQIYARNCGKVVKAHRGETVSKGEVPSPSRWPKASADLHELKLRMSLPRI